MHCESKCVLHFADGLAVGVIDDMVTGKTDLGEPAAVVLCCGGIQADQVSFRDKFDTPVKDVSIP